MQSFCECFRFDFGVSIMGRLIDKFIESVKIRVGIDLYPYSNFWPHRKVTRLLYEVVQCISFRTKISAVTLDVTLEAKL